MKTNKSKIDKKSTVKAAKKQLEISLAGRFFEVVKDLGHDAEHIAEDIAKISKVAAKKLSKKFQEVKVAVEHQLENISNKENEGKKQKSVKKDTAKSLEKAAKSANKTVEKALANAKPLTGAVKEAVVIEDKTAVIDKDPVKSAITKTRTMASKLATTSTDTKKAVVKAVSNNPVKKVSTKDVPTKKNT